MTGHRVIASGLPGTAFAGTVCAHPLRDRGYDFPVPLIPADHVTTEQGTGFVHIAPGHGAEDFEAVARYNAGLTASGGEQRPIETPATVDDDGCFYDHVPGFAGKHVYKVNDEIADALAAADRLLARGKLVHSYPHSWRSKAPLIFRNTLQWFISMETTGLRAIALDAIDQVRWVPPSGRARIRSMIETRPDWVLSRQRVWGVPIAVFVSREDGTPLRDPNVVERIAAIVEAEGADAWFTSDKARFLAPDYDPDAYDKVTDILDVWFESGTTHSFVLEKRPELMWPASPLSRRVGPAPGLVPQLAPRILRHTRPRALRRRAHPWLRCRRRGAQDVEVAWQRHRPGAGERALRRGHPPPLGGQH